MTDLTALIARLAATTGPDRETDLAIAVFLQPDGDIARVIQSRRGFDAKPGMAWDLHGASVCFEKYTADGRCTYNGGIPLPQYTGSIDAALTLVSDGWSLWRIDQYHDDKNPAWGWGVTLRRHVRPDFGVSVGESRASMPLAICIAALKARAATEAPHG